MKKIIISLMVIFCAVIITGCQSGKTPAKPTAKHPTQEEKKATVVKPEDTKNELKIVTTASGLKYEDKKVGNGTEAKVGDTVKVNYRGWLDDGTEFDSSKKPGREPFPFTIGEGNVIKGWDEGLVGMKIGGVRELTIPSDLGYGPGGQGPIPPNATLHFEIELLGIN